MTWKGRDVTDPSGSESPPTPLPCSCSLTTLLFAGQHMTCLKPDNEKLFLEPSRAQVFGKVTVGGGGKGAGREGAAANEGMTLILMTAHVPWSSASQSSYPLLSGGPLSHSPFLALTQASLQSPFLLHSSSGVVGGTCIPWYVGRGQETNSRSWPFPSIMWVPGWDSGLLTHLTKLAFDLPSFF